MPGCPSNDDDGTADEGAATGDTDPSGTSAADPTGDPTTSSMPSDSTTGADTTGASTENPTDATTGDPATTQADSSDAESSEGTMGTAECVPTGVPCDDCLIVDHCCAEFAACTADDGCDCVVVCMMAGGTGEACGGECGLPAPPPELNALFACFDTAACGNVCMS
jgi:hypothetical protein